MKVRVGVRADGRTDEHLVALRIARASGLMTAVVGVDSDDVLDRVRTIGVDFGQGFRLAPPVETTTVAALLSDAAGRTARRAERSS